VSENEAEEVDRVGEIHFSVGIRVSPEKLVFPGVIDPDSPVEKEGNQGARFDVGEYGSDRRRSYRVGKPERYPRRGLRLQLVAKVKEG